MEPLNLVRRFTRALQEGAFGKNTAQVEKIANLARLSEHFALPDGGMLLGDLQLKAIPSEAELRLPFPAITLECRSTFGELMLLICVETPGHGIAVHVWGLRGDEWGYWAPCFVKTKPGQRVIDSEAVVIECEVWEQYLGEPLSEEKIQNFYKNSHVSYLLDFLNALACSNIGIEKLPRKSNAKVKNGLPFDSYHVLTIKPSATSAHQSLGGSHRSPREHLRRGHIRRLETGARIWVNATVVNPGSPGRIDKDYRIGPHG